MTEAIRRLTETDAAAYREIRLEALRLHPEAFSAAFELESSEPLSFFAARLAGNAVFAGFDGAAAMGIAGFRRDPGLKGAPTGQFSGMYVRSAARGSGLSRRLVETVIDHARRHVEQIHLSVTAGNDPAHRLYASLGFVAYGREPRALKIDGRYFDEIAMVRILRETP